MIFNPIIAMLHDYAHDRWHPVVLRASPRPSEGPDEMAKRYKSVGHHTDGFPSRDEALAYCHGPLREQVEESAIGEVRDCVEKAFPWDGEGVPAIVTFMATDTTGVLMPVL